VAVPLLRGTPTPRPPALLAIDGGAPRQAANTPVGGSRRTAAVGANSCPDAEFGDGDGCEEIVTASDATSTPAPRCQRDRSKWPAY